MAETPFKFYCDECGQKISVREKQYGMKSNCPNCKVAITVPVPEGGESMALAAEPDALLSTREVLIFGCVLLLGALIAGVFVAL
ncbi:hypothetical protein SAMN02745181_3201 [Rubritalea squalenifaciens DSM 18772]|uniref:Uncharacterized protein n=1 Tax=Rubritalea squalenifaciens DSM 18772 TaxID=1123071 RepID=A0A1M6PIM5_9BACT|nr:hypothetical protein [Rubritalea squalenifaciens]SHK07773.1 hypothetical protein SAMN02745181_3201 [Rubritalea squalenifaciens DSM 18772]